MLPAEDRSAPDHHPVISVLYELIGPACSKDVVLPVGNDRQAGMGYQPVGQPTLKRNNE